MSKLIIFGAGASFGSDSRNTPLLGTNLFEKLALGVENHLQTAMKVRLNP